MASSLSVADELYIAFLSIWVCISVASNVLVIACIRRKATEKKKNTGRSSLKSTDILIVNLAINDILLAGIVLPQKIHDISHTHEFFECKSFKVYHFSISCTVSIIHTVAVVHKRNPLYFWTWERVPKRY